MLVIMLLMYYNSIFVPFGFLTANLAGTRPRTRGSGSNACEIFCPDCRRTEFLTQSCAVKRSGTPTTSRSSSFSDSTPTPVRQVCLLPSVSMATDLEPAAGCFVRGALPGQPVECLGYGSWRWTIWAGIAYFSERVVREVRPSLPSATASHSLIEHSKRFAPAARPKSWAS